MKFQMNVFNQTQIKICGALLSLLLVSCGGGSSSDPLSSYDVKGGQPHQTPREKTVTLSSGKIEIRQPGANADNVIRNSFIEEEANEVLIEVVIRDPKITTYKLEISSFPQSPNAPSLDETSTKGLFSLKWTPPRGHLPPGTWSQSHPVKISAKVIESSIPELVGLLSEKEIIINVNKTQSVPEIKEYSNLKSGIEEGQPANFRVVVKDPSAASSGFLPDLVFMDVPQSNTEAICSNFRSRIRNADPTQVVRRLSDSTFEYNYVIDTNNLPNAHDRRGIETDQASKVQICFNMRVIGTTGGLSEVVKVQADAKYSVQEPTLTWSDNLSQTTLPANQETILRFQIASQGLGDLTVPTQQLARMGTQLRSKVELTCEEAVRQETTTSKNCSLSIKPSCPTRGELPQEAKVKMTLKVENKLGARVKAKDFQREFTVLAQEPDCSRPAARVQRQPPTRGTRR